MKLFENENAMKPMNELRCHEMTMTWNWIIWDDMKWNVMTWNERKLCEKTKWLNEIKWHDMKLNVMEWNDMKLKWNWMIWIGWTNEWN